MPNSGFPTPDAGAARALGDALRAVAYTEDAMVDLLGDDAYGGDPGDAPLHLRRLPNSKLAVAIRLLFLEQPVASNDVERALGRDFVSALATTGLAHVGRDVVPRGRILPVADVLVASDGQVGPGGEAPPDYVATFTPTSQLCDALTPRRRVDRALDVGTGNGALAVIAARHARRVVATDVNPRALAFAALNAALNDVGNVELRQGSLFEPVGSDRFDLITCNAPFVVSPESRFAYRDSGRRGDEFSAQLVAGAAAHLADGGHATLLVSWVAADADEPDERALEWAEGTGCDAWILSTSLRDPLDHAAAWSPSGTTDEEFAAALDAWTRYFGELGVATVSEGAILLHRRPGRIDPIRVDEIEAETFDAGDQVRRAFAARARLASFRRESELLDERVALAMPVTVERDVEPGRAGAARVVLAEGTAQVVEATPDAVAAVAALDGRRPLGDALAGLAASDRRSAVALAHELLGIGALRFT